jgi:hypothetical protein
MDLKTFDRRAHEIFDEIPPEYREGVDGLVVEAEVLEHPSLPGIYTLGECRSEFYPSEYGGAGEVRSIVVLHYGSFRELAATDESFDWEEELWETITHEVRHHLESLASEDALEVQDYVEDQNFARREGEPFDPFFYREGRQLAERAWEVDDDVFVEHEVEPAPATGGAGQRGGEVVFSLPGQRPGRARRYRVARPEPLGDVHFVTLSGVRSRRHHRGELVLVLIRRRGWRERVGAVFSGRAPEVLQSEGRAEAVKGEG